MNRTSAPWLVGGCIVLLLLVMIPIGLVVWAFNNGRVGLPQTGQFPPALTLAPANPTTGVTRATPAGNGGGGQAGGSTAATSGSNQIPSTGSLAQPVIQPPRSLAELYTQANPGAVSILVSAQGGQSGGAGSGFILSNDGYIVTNNHVVADADTYIVRFYNNADIEATLVGADPDSDLAILKVNQMADGAHPLPLGDSNKLQVGDSVVAIGNPFALGTSMSYGIVSALGRTIPSLTPQFNIPSAIQTDAAINPGNSGGPLINMNGEVIGIDAQIRTGDQGGGNVGIGFAIPVNILKQVYSSLIQNGSYTWPYLGVGTPAETPLSIHPGNLAAQRGALLAQVVPNGPAAQAGVQEGDIVVAADGQKITSFDDLLSYIAFKRPGDQVKFTVLRNQQQGDVTVTLGERPKGNQQQ